MIPGPVWRLANRVYRTPWIARVLFGVDASSLGPDDHAFDITTFVLWRRALREVGAGTRVVDLGTGSQAILALALAQRTGCSAIGLDIDPEVLARARENVARSGAPVELRQSQLLDALPEPFDLVLFNPPYVPTAEGTRRDLPESRRSQWDGGADGLDAVRTFLAAIAARPHPLRFLLGVNEAHVDARALDALVRGHPGIRLDESRRHPLLPVRVFAGAAGGSAAETPDHSPAGAFEAKRP